MRSSADAKVVPETVKATAVDTTAATNLFFIDPLFFKYLLHLM
jgi:hypothetical protein